MKTTDIGASWRHVMITGRPRGLWVTQPKTRHLDRLGQLGEAHGLCLQRRDGISTGLASSVSIGECAWVLCCCFALRPVPCEPVLLLFCKSPSSHDTCAGDTASPPAWPARACGSRACVARAQPALRLRACCWAVCSLLCWQYGSGRACARCHACWGLCCSSAVRSQANL